MTRFDRGTVQARAQEILFTSVEPITEHAACRRALDELYGKDLERLLDAAASLAVTTIRALRQSTYNLPDRRQLLVQSMPEYIVVDTPDGGVYKRSSDATGDEIRQHARNARRHHRAQAKKWEKFIEDDLNVAKDVPGEVTWGGENGLESIIKERKLKVLEAAK